MIYAAISINAPNKLVVFITVVLIKNSPWQFFFSFFKTEQSDDNGIQSEEKKSDDDAGMADAGEDVGVGVGVGAGVGKWWGSG